MIRSRARGGHCRSCGGTDVQRSRTRGVVERVLRTIGLRPWRCLDCGIRFMGKHRVVY